MERLQELWDSYRYQILAVVALAVAFCGWQLKGQSKTQSVNVAESFASGNTSSFQDSSALQNRRKVWVDVKGAVNKPGLYQLKNGSRVNEALAAAGGQTANADMKQVNLAKQLSDQQVIYIPAQGEQVPAGMAGGAATDVSSAGGTDDDSIVNLNTATKDQLCQISGIGDKKADKILQYREQHGQFKSIDELTQVDGFGEKTVENIKGQLAV